MTLLTTVAELVPPLITKRLIDDVLTPPSDPTLLPWLVLGLLVVGTYVWVAGVVRNWLGTWIGLRTSEAMRADLYRSLQFLPLRFHDKRKVGALVSRMSNDSDLVEVYLVFDIPFIVSNALMLIGILGLLIYMNWELTLYVLLPIPPIIFGGPLGLEPTGSILATLLGQVVASLFPPERVDSRHSSGEGVRSGASRRRPIRPPQRRTTRGFGGSGAELGDVLYDHELLHEFRGILRLVFRGAADPGKPAHAGRTDGVRHLHMDAVSAVEMVLGTSMVS